MCWWLALDLWARGEPWWSKATSQARVGNMQQRARCTSKEDRRRLTPGLPFAVCPSPAPCERVADSCPCGKRKTEDTLPLCVSALCLEAAASHERSHLKGRTTALHQAASRPRLLIVTAGRDDGRGGGRDLDGKFVNTTSPVGLQITPEGCSVALTGPRVIS